MEYRSQGELTVKVSVTGTGAYSVRVQGDATSAVAEREVAIAEQTDVSVLVVADSDTARRALARRIHDRSARRDGAWISIAGSGGTPDDLAASFERARGGTLFIDSAEALEASLQRRLLQMLDVCAGDEGGANEMAAVRVIAGASPRLMAEAASRGFSEQLLYRLNIIRIDAMPDAPPEHARSRGVNPQS